MSANRSWRRPRAGARWLLLGLAAGLSVGRLQGQAVPDSVHLRNDCRLAAQVLRTGQPANKRTWAEAFIPSCGSEGAAVLAETWTARSLSDDTLELNSLRRSLQQVRDERIFRSLLQSVESPSASSSARLVAWSLLFNTFNRSAWLPESEWEITPVDEVCSVGYISGGRPIVVDPLPTDYRQQIDAAAQRVVGSGQEYRVRRFASCVHQFVQYSLARDGS